MKTSRIFMLISLFVMLSLVLCAGAALAADASDFTYTSSNGEVTITGYTGTDTELVIPSEIDGMPVMGIGGGAFRSCTSLTSITIPSSVTSIGDRAFHSCTSLTSITIPSSVTSIGGGAFGSCTSLTSITIPSSVTSIGDGAFYNCTGLTSIIIPDSVTSVGDAAFHGCDNLLTVELPEAFVDRIANLFSSCLLKSIRINGSDTALPFIDGAVYTSDEKTLLLYAGGDGRTEFVVPDGVTRISDYAFDGCESLTGITIPGSVTSIGDYAFSWCTSLTSIDIPDSVTDIGDFTFNWCTSLTSVTLSNSITGIGESVFFWCNKLASITIPSSVTSIGKHAFYGCKGLTSITIPSSVTSMGDCVFCDCTNLSSITLPDSIMSIGDEMFHSCTSLTSITIPSSVTSIGDRAFYRCTSLTGITIPSSVKSIGDDVFTNCGELVAQVERGSYAHTWCVEHDIDVDVIPSLQLIPASRIDPEAIPFGMAAEVELVNGLYHVTIDNEATDWDAVYTLQEPMHWYNPDTGESGVAVEKVMMGAMFGKPEGAAYSKSVVGNVWATDEEILNALDQETSVSDLTNTINSWKLDVALFDDDGGITLNEFTEEQYAPYTYAILWLDENGEEMFAEKVEFCFEHTAPEASHTYAKKLIPAESIMGNVENAEGVTCEIADGSIITTQMDANAEHVTEIVAPENAVSYSMHDNFYDPWAEKYDVTNGVVGFMRSGTLRETITTSSLICWYDADGKVIGGGWITFTSKLGQGAEVPEPAEGVQLIPASRIDPDAIPFGMAAEVELKDGLYHVTIDNEATDWDAVYTLQEPMHWYNPDTGESGVAVEKVMVGAMFDKPEGAAYSKSVVGNVWATDEEILNALDQETSVSDLTNTINSWKLDVALFGDDGSITLNEFTPNPNPYTYAILWLDENGEEMFAEKAEFCFEYTAPEASHSYAKKLIPAESIMGNVENAEGVTCEIADGSIVTTQMDANAEHVTEIVAPENAVSYSMHDNFYDPWAEKYEVTNGVVGFMRSGPLKETITTSSLICWYDADGKVIGGGWITFTSKLGEKLTPFILPASMQTIEEEAFAGSAVQSVIIPDGCTAIGSRAFADCAQLRQIVIPASVTDIAADAFSGCANVTIIAPEGSAGQALAEAMEGFGWRAE